MLKQLIYISQETAPLSDQDLLDLLRVSRQRNQQNNLTGMLVYRNSIFLQVIEGEEDDLEPVWASIQADRRHTNIVLIWFVPIAARDFPDWSMGFKNLSGQDFSQQPGYTPFMEEDFPVESLSAKPGRALDFLLTLKSND